MIQFTFNNVVHTVTSTDSQINVTELHNALGLPIKQVISKFFKGVGAPLKSQSVSVRGYNAHTMSSKEAAAEWLSWTGCTEITIDGVALVNPTKAPKRLQVGDVCPSKNFGDVVITEVLKGSKCKILFLNTGTEAEVGNSNLQLGVVRDYNVPSVYGVGYLGYGKHRSFGKGARNKVYDLWQNMMQRCYSELFHEKIGPTYKNCTVTERWHSFQNFAEDIALLDNYEEWMSCPARTYDLDKDMKILGNKIYSPEACSFVLKSINVSFATSGYSKQSGSQVRTMYFESKEGVVYEVHKLSPFCKKMGLVYANMFNMLKGINKSSKGFTVYSGTDFSNVVKFN